MREFYPHGILIINKPKAWTSHDVVAKVRGILGVKKVGHAGTLDPAAEGVLVVMVGKKATRLSEKLRGQDKEYKIEIEFGRSTTTGDTEGQATEEVELGSQTLKSLNPATLKAVLGKFKGEIEQTVPAYSAVKVDGQRLYKLARAGRAQEVQRPKRRIIIHKIELLQFQPVQKNLYPQAKIRVVCSSGTYTRVLAEDLGQALGLPAYQKSLLRTRVGNFSLDQSVGIKELAEAADPWTRLKPISAFVGD